MVVRSWVSLAIVGKNAAKQLVIVAFGSEGTFNVQVTFLLREGNAQFDLVSNYSEQWPGDSVQ